MTQKWHAKRKNQLLVNIAERWRLCRHRWELRSHTQEALALGSFTAEHISSSSSALEVPGQQGWLRRTRSSILSVTRQNQPFLFTDNAPLNSTVLFSDFTHYLRNTVQNVHHYLYLLSITHTHIPQSCAQHHIMIYHVGVNTGQCLYCTQKIRVKMLNNGKTQQLSSILFIFSHGNIKGISNSDRL